MENWLIILLIGIGTVAVILIVSMSTGSIIISAADRFYRKLEKKVAKAVMAFLPKNDCKECGLETCKAYSEEWAKNHECPEKCPYVTEEMKQKITDLQAKQDAFIEERISTRPKGKY